MIEKNRQKPPEIEFLEASLRNLPKGYPRRVELENSLKRYAMGYAGERQLDFYMSLLPEKSCRILNNLRLEFEGVAFEIDTVLLTCWFALVLDVKNYRGTLFFNLLLKQCKRIYNEQEESIQDPISQSINHRYQLANFWKLHQLPFLPLHPLVIVSHSSTSVVTNPGLEKDLTQKVIHSEYLIERMEELQQVFTKKRYSDSQLDEVAKFLHKHHKPKQESLADKFQISATDFLTGVYCPACTNAKMKWGHGTWRCPACNSQSDQAHFQRVSDYFLLQSPSLSNGECRKLLEIGSPQIARRLLNQMNLQAIGHTKNRRYDFQVSLNK